MVSFPLPIPLNHLFQVVILKSPLLQKEASREWYCGVVILPLWHMLLCPPIPMSNGCCYKNGSGVWAVHNAADSRCGGCWWRDLTIRVKRNQGMRTPGVHEGQRGGAAHAQSSSAEYLWNHFRNLKGKPLSWRSCFPEEAMWIPTPAMMNNKRVAFSLSVQRLNDIQSIVFFLPSFMTSALMLLHMWMFG